MSEINLSDLPKTEIVDVHIASVWSRVAAYLLNNLFIFLIWLPFIVMVVFTLDESKKLVSESSLFNTPEYFAITFFISLAVYLVFGIVQLYYMSRDGQSLGKKIMGIRVLKSDGSNPGFGGTVLIREVAWAFIVGIIIIAVMLVVNETGGDLVSLLMAFINFIMLFSVKRDRRTLYDMMADTVVVQLPPRR
ncbi:RDD family protein [Neisseria subflava]|uniref:RDD family protein n=1 Tax=Neisseria subflava TaxID=28449 RepID=A0A9X9HXU9_NEISU|nr:RDD family protein [Neisseria subflava]UTG71602.1 RDD family protein [Neisseria subflava]